MPPIDALLCLFTGLFFFLDAEVEGLQFGSCDLVVVKGVWFSDIAMGTIDWPMGRIPRGLNEVKGDDGEWRAFPIPKGWEGQCMGLEKMGGES